MTKAKASYVYVACDIDETIGYLSPAFIHYYNTRYQLDLPEHILNTHKLAPFVAYLRENYPRELMMEIYHHYANIETRRESLEIYLESKPIPGSAEALHILTNLGATVAYYTARPENLREFTELWLRKNSYPEGTITFCPTNHKLVHIINHSRMYDRVIFVDDTMTRHASLWPNLLKRKPETAAQVARQLTMIQFGPVREDCPLSEHPNTYPFLYSETWSDVLVHVKGFFDHERTA
jgi:uncharacterized HAD superfamily protein